MDKIGRLGYVDALRALALFGILFVHSHDCFNFYVQGLPYGPFDWIVDVAYRELFLGKSFMVFALLFGLSFSLQMMRTAQRGDDFRWRFLWRMVLLLGFGVIHSFFYCGDILIIFAVLSIIPWLLWLCSARVLGIVAFCFLLSPIALFNDLSGNPAALFQWYLDYVAQHQLPRAPSPLSSSWWQIASWNIQTGTQYAWLYMIWSNRLCLVIGMLLLGAALGKGRWLDLKVHLHARAAWMCAIIFVILSLIANGALGQHLPTVLAIWRNIAFVLAFCAFASCILRSQQLQRCVRPFCALGRMSLTCYVTQSMVMTWFLASWGAGQLTKLNKVELALCACGLYLVQLVLCTIWLRYFKLGPLEGLWRYLTCLGK